MKKIYLLFVAAALAACSAEPVENEAFESLNATVTGKNKVSAAVAENPMGFYAGQSGKLKGTLEVWNDCSNLYVQITPTDENPEEVSIWLLNDRAELNGGKNQVENGSDVTEIDPQDLLWTFPVANFDLNEDLFVYVQAYGDYAGAIVQEKVSYTNYDFVFEDCGCEESFTYVDSGNMTYTFTYISEEDMTGAELVFTFAQGAYVDGLDGWEDKGQTRKMIMDLTACTTYNWTVTLDAKCSGNSQSSNVWTDFKVNDVSKKDHENDKFVQACN